MDDLYEFNRECLLAHNGLRKAHKVGYLKYDFQLAEASQRYAQSLAEAEVLEHSSNFERTNIGENLAFSYKQYVNYKFSGRGATVTWYSEIRDYDFSQEKQKEENPPTGHFSQVIWKDCRKAGFGRAQSANKGWYIVGRYWPSGNVLGRCLGNVLPSSYCKWEDVPVVLQYLEELRTMEYTSARKHVLDTSTSKTQVKTTNGVRRYTVTETFESAIHGEYSAREDFQENPTKLPRPEYQDSLEEDYLDEESIIPLVDIRSEEYTPDDYIFNIENFRMKILGLQNYYRENHVVGILQLDETLNEMAQEWAQTLAQEKCIGLSNYRFKDSELGENIATLADCGIEESAKRTVSKWYDEERLYTYEKEPCNFYKIGHFTQIVWKNSHLIGIGIAESADHEDYFVCFYYPPGNVAGMFKTNVLNPSSH